MTRGAGPRVTVPGPTTTYRSTTAGSISRSTGGCSRPRANPWSGSTLVAAPMTVSSYTPRCTGTTSCATRWAVGQTCASSIGVGRVPPIWSTARTGDTWRGGGSTPGGGSRSNSRTSDEPVEGEGRHHGRIDGGVLRLFEERRGAYFRPAPRHAPALIADSGASRVLGNCLVLNRGHLDPGWVPPDFASMGG